MVRAGPEKEVRKKRSGPARIAYGPHTGILSGQEAN